VRLTTNETMTSNKVVNAILFAGTTAGNSVSARSRRTTSPWA